MRVFFVRRQQIAPGIWQYFFRSERTIDFLPGQYADLHLAVPRDKRGMARTFSFTSLPDDEVFSFVTKHFSKQSDYKQYLLDMRPGDEARLDEALGDLVLPKLASIPLVFIAGGIGLASFASLLRQISQSADKRSVHLFYQLRDPAEAIFGDLIEAADINQFEVRLKPDQLETGAILQSTPRDSLIYISGSQDFVESLQSGFESSGILRSHLLFDYYDGYSEL